MDKKIEETFPKVDFRKPTPNTIPDLICEIVNNKFVKEKDAKITDILDVLDFRQNS